METLTSLEPVWSLSPNFRCPVVGTCLTVGEQGKILKKSGHDTKRATDYEIHQVLMEHLDSENQVSRRTDRFIRHKHKKNIACFSGLSSKDLQTHWDEAAKNGDIGALFYVIMSRPDITPSLKVKAFGDVHMLSHSSMNDVLNSRKNMDDEIQANRALIRRLSKEKEKNREMRTTIKALHKDIKAAQALCCTQDKSKPNEEKDETLIKENELLSSECSRLRSALDLAGEKTLEDAEHIEKLEEIIRVLQSDNEVLSAELRRAVCPCPENEGCPKSCGSPSQSCIPCSQRVLMVGGITKMESFYRDVVESNGNEFIYHNGYIRNSSRQIDDMVAQADLVLCPVNCISHNTCQRIKKLCKKYNKRCKMLPGASLNMVSRAMTEDILPVLRG